MAENPSGKGPGDPGRHERAEPARESVSRPPVARRDPRADPDDEPISARVDVVSVERPSERNPNVGGDALTNAALSLRRELAKLHQQAAAVERTIEDQRRERSDALERVEYATTRVSDLEQKLEQSEGEVASVRRLHDVALADLQKVRSERDDLLRAIEAAKVAAEDLGKARVEAETLREAHDEALRAAATYEAELGEIRKREQAGSQKVSDTQAELSGLRERVEHTSAELTQSREEATTAKSEIARLRQEATTAGETISKLREDIERDRIVAKEQVDRAERSLSEARTEARAFEEKLGTIEGDLGALRVEVAQSRTEITRIERELEAARHSRDVSLERALMAEKETEGVRKDAERLQRELEAAVIAGAHAQTRAAAAERAKSFVEDSVRQLRDEVTTAFARWRSISPSGAPPNTGSVAPPTRAMPPSYQDVTLANAAANAASAAPAAPAAPAAAIDHEAPNAPPPVTKRGGEQAPEPMRGTTTSFPPISAEARPMSQPVPPLAAPPAIDLNLTDDEWPSKPPPPPHGAPESIPVTTIHDADLISEKEPRHHDNEPASMSPTSRSVPPPLPSRPRPPPVPPPPARRASIPPVVYPSVTPPTPPPTDTRTGVATTPPPASSSDVAAAAPAPPPPKEKDASGIQVLSQERDDLLSRLSDPDTGRAAAMALRNHTEWLKGRPPVELLEALTHLDYDIEHPLFELARSWERESLCRSLIHSLKDEPDPKLREHGAWLLKHLGSPAIWPMMSELVRNEEEPPAVRRWLLEAIERLVASRGVGWGEVGDLVTMLVRHPDPSLRDGVIGVVAALERSDEKRRVLLELLRTDDDEVVLASAVHALTSALPIELDPAVAERLLGHPSARVQRSVVDFIERSKRAARNA